MMIRKTREIKIGGLLLGAANPVRLQTMLKSSLDDPKALSLEASVLVKEGAEILRVALPSVACVEDVYKSLSDLEVPLVADCHFQSAIAIKAIEMGFDKIRLNPGNISKEGLLDAINMAKDKSLALRFGFNSGSFESEGGIDMAQSALELDAWIKSQDFYNYVISLKSSSVLDTVQANRYFSMKSDTPLHIGVTATGPMYEGIIKSSAGLGSLMMDGVGDTVRVSLTGPALEELRVAKLLRQISTGETESLELISCPTCSRRRIDVQGLIQELLEKLSPEDHSKKVQLAIMGCEVNGPGEAKEADLGVCGTQKGGLLIKKGEIIKSISKENIIEKLIEELRTL